MEITESWMSVYDTNNDGSVNGFDDMELDHLPELLDTCDTNGNGSIEACEYHACVIAYENEWRDGNCPDYGHVYCDCPFAAAPECPSSWSCDDVEFYMIEAFEYYDTNNDGVINPEDNIDEDHLEDYMALCDLDNDGNIEKCEVHSCIMDIENAYRAEYCPDFGLLYCECNPEP
jgi:hypothetical protein